MLWGERERDEGRNIEGREGREIEGGN